MTPEAADLLRMMLLGAVIGWALRSALFHLVAWVRARRLETLLRKSKIFRYHP